MPALGGSWGEDEGTLSMTNERLAMKRSINC